MATVGLVEVLLEALCVLQFTILSDVPTLVKPSLIILVVYPCLAVVAWTLVGTVIARDKAKVLRQRFRWPDLVQLLPFSEREKILDMCHYLSPHFL